MNNSGRALGPVRVSQDTFDHDKGQKSQLRGAVTTGFSFIFSSGFFCVSPGFLCSLSLVRKSLQTVEKLPDFRAEKKAQNPVTSLAVMVVSVPSERLGGLAK